MVAYVEEQTELPALAPRALAVDSNALSFVQRCLVVPYKSRCLAEFYFSVFKKQIEMIEI